MPWTRLQLNDHWSRTVIRPVH